MYAEDLCFGLILQTFYQIQRLKINVHLQDTELLLEFENVIHFHTIIIVFMC